MRIGIEVSPIIGDRGGVGWHLYYLLQALVGLNEDFELVCYVPPGTQARHDLEPWMKDPRLAWIETGRFMMRWRGTLDRLDLFHGPNFKMRTQGRRGGIVTLHDVWLDRHPEYSTKVAGQQAAFRRTRRTARRARKVITVSRFSAHEIAAVYGLTPDLIVTIHNGVADEFRPMKDDDAMEGLRRRLHIPPGGFVLFVGGADPRKNHRTFLQAAARQEKDLGGRTLILVGDPVHRFGSYYETARACGLESTVVCPGRVPIADLKLLYTYADLFVFPSLYEGFGMPVLEAMACGAPTITSATSALPEIAGDAALLVNPTDVMALGQTIVRVLLDSVLGESLRTKGLARVKEFTWRNAAIQTLALYRELTA
jgi:glycosyltransferase involved in cell wall biosynthesis